MLDWNNQPIRTPIETESVNPCVRLYGVGPAETTCAECRWTHSYHQSARWYKCDQRPKHKRGLSGDHKVRFPACKRYEKRKEE
jgi:hypothetical protein